MIRTLAFTKWLIIQLTSFPTYELSPRHYYLLYIMSYTLMRSAYLYKHQTKTRE